MQIYLQNFLISTKKLVSPIIFWLPGYQERALFASMYICPSLAMYNVQNVDVSWSSGSKLFLITEYSAGSNWTNPHHIWP